MFSGKVEIGQGILTALAQIAAEELDVSLAQVRMARASTAMSPDEGTTSGSLSVQDSGTALRHACAEARAIHLRIAAARLNATIESLTVDNGDIVGANGARTSYWELADAALLDREATGQVAPKPSLAHRIVGSPIARLDLADKIFGRPCFIHDLELPRMLHGRVLRPPSADATLIDCRRGRGPRAAGCRRRRSRRFVHRRARRKRSGRPCGRAEARRGRDVARMARACPTKRRWRTGSRRRRPRPASSTARPHRHRGRSRGR